jgi:hypothetical protein
MKLKKNKRDGVKSDKKKRKKELKINKRKKESAS